MAGGRLVEGHALVVSGGGGREVYEERTLQPLYKLSSSEWVFDEPTDEEKLRASPACSNGLRYFRTSLPSCRP